MSRNIKKKKQEFCPLRNSALQLPSSSPLSRIECFELIPIHMTGKLVKES